MSSQVVAARGTPLVSKPAQPGERHLPALKPPLKPLPLWQTPFYFGIPAAAYALALGVLRPRLQGIGFTAASSTGLAVGSLAAALVLVSVAAYRLEGNPFSWAAFRDRFRLHALRGSAWLWSLGVLGAMAISVFWLESLREMLLAQFGIMAPEVPYPGSPLPLLAVLLLVTCGEEFWWRGYILPRQELAHGRVTWLIHGTLWALFHIATWWEVPTLWVGTLALTFVAQRLKNTTPGIAVHLVFDFVAMLAAADFLASVVAASAPGN